MQVGTITAEGEGRRTIFGEGLEDAEHKQLHGLVRRDQKDDDFPQAAPQH